MSGAESTSVAVNPVNKMVLDIVIPAAGKGRRLGGAIPKQYLDINGRPLLAHTLERLQRINPRRVILVVSEDDNFWRDVPGVENCEIAFGGDSRANSVLNGLLALDTGTASLTPDWVLVHDAARPCVKVSDIARLIAAVGEHEVGGILGVKIVETVKHLTGPAEDQVRAMDIHQTLDREQLWLAQTPQLFRRGLLKQALTQGLAKAPSPATNSPGNKSLDLISGLITDESSALENMGYSPLMVEGSKDNIKVTTAEDLELAAFFLRKQLNVEKHGASRQAQTNSNPGGATH